MVRKLAVVLLSGIICLSLTVTSALAVKYNEAPMLKVKVAAGELPPVKERLPKEPLVIEPVEKIGEYGGTLKFAEVEPKSIWSLKTLYKSGLFRYNMDCTNYFADVAKSYSFSEDLKTLTIKLREGHKWSDGHPLTVDDIIFWWEDIALNRELIPVPDPFWKPGGEPAEFEKVDDYMLRIHFLTPYPVAMDLLGRTCFSADERFVVPKHYLKKWHIKYNPKANELAKEEGYDNWKQAFKAHLSPSLHTLGGRPNLSAWVPVKVSEDVVVLERNPYFHQVDTEGNQLPYIDRIRCIITGNREIQTLKACSGELDFATYYLDFKDMPVFVQNQERGNYRILEAKTLHVSEMVLMPNQNYQEDPFLRKLFSSKQFRIALSIAINRSVINKTIFFGKGKPFQANTGPGMSFFKPEWGKVYTEYDPESANKILDSLGLTDRDSDGFRLRPDGKRLRVQIETGTPTGPKIETMEMVARDWEKIGIKADVKLFGKALWVERKLPYYKGQIGVHHLDRCDLFGRASPNHYAYDRPLATMWGPLWTRWFITDGEKGIEPPEKIKEHKKLFDQFRQTLPGTPEFNRLGEKYYQFFADELPMIGTVGFQPQPIIVNNKLRNIPEKNIYWTSDNNFYAPYQPQQWYFEK